MALSEARFVTGSTMRHVVVMSVTGSVGLMFMFLVDAAALFWVSQLGVERLVAALGFAWIIQFSTISVGIGLMIAATAMVSRAIGQNRFEAARQMATSALLVTFFIQTLIGLIVLAFRRDVLAFSGASGETLDIAARFLLISVPSLPLIAFSMVTAAILRAAGDGMRAMYVTLSAGLIAMLLDPLFIIWLDLRTDGAAIVINISRLTSGLLGIYFVARVHGMIARPDLSHLRAFLRPFALIAIPAVLTQLSTPFGNIVVTYFVSDYGDSAVAGWAVISRITVLAFGGIFALSGAIGGIIGQNFGANRPDRIASAYRDSLFFCIIYVAIAWSILAVSADTIIALFQLSGEGARLLEVFLRYAVGSFVFIGALFVANSAFNNLGRPLWSTAFNWLRDGVLTAPFALALAPALAAPGVIYAQAGASAVAGLCAFATGWVFIAGLRDRQLPGAAPDMQRKR